MMRAALRAAIVTLGLLASALDTAAAAVASGSARRSAVWYDADVARFTNSIVASMTPRVASSGSAVSNA